MKYLILQVLFFCSFIVRAASFNHPGLLHNIEDLNRIESLVSNEVFPSYGSYELLINKDEASYKYQLKGPFENISRAGEFGYTKTPCENDFKAAYYNSLLWNITKDERHAAKAMEILRAYAGRLKKIHGPDDPLCAGLQGFMLVNAAEIMRYTYSKTGYSNGWDSDDTKKTESMFRGVFLPVLRKFYNTKPYSNGNWGISVNKMVLALGIYLDDRELYNTAIDFFYNSIDNGSLPNYISETGQIQETGRDQEHCMLGLGCMAELCECAWKQGDNLYGALDNRLLKGYEYLSKVNLGYKDVPYKVWKDATGKYSNWQCIGEAGMGQFRSVFEIAYNHYVYRCGIKMPYTEKVLKRIRPEGEGFVCDNPGFGTLLFYLGKPENKRIEGKIEEYLSEAYNDWTFGTAQIEPVDSYFYVTNTGIKMKKEKIKYDAGKYPYIEVSFLDFPIHKKQNWLRISYSVKSAPEFWTLSEKDAVFKKGNVYIFDVRKIKSNNGNSFSSKIQNVDLLLDFGDIEYVGIKSIISKNSLNN
ncbi:alginate lyase family protein [Bacteroides sp.]|uniref:alginate lyase family protein n=1 Tax=Bacteroides sp. TaxID=29523 RepID=UPI00258BEF9E|nr:alginate lyase family protein [Bacteroides sp.]